MIKKPQQVVSSNSPRLEDVAQRAGVSSATVSRVLNQPEKVTETLRQKVHKAVDELGYVPHGAARALASRRSRTIGAVVPTIDNAIFATTLQSLQYRISEFGYTLLLASSEYDLEREKKECQTLVEKSVDGLILVGEMHDAAVYTMLINKRVPYANIWVYDEASPHPCVGFDNYKLAGNLAHYLMDIGHRKIAMVAGINQGNDRATQRSNGVRDALVSRGFGLKPEWYIEKSYEINEGRNAAKQLLSAADRPSAIMCGNDILALGVLFECLARGLSVPNDISITGYDGLDLAAQVSPSLTTVDIPNEQMGLRAADCIIGQIQNLDSPQKILLNGEIVIRESTAPPAA